MKNNMIMILALLVLANCGSESRHPYPVHFIPSGTTSFKICQNWSDAQPLDSTRYAGAAYCLNGQLYGLFDRYAEGGVHHNGFVALADGTYPAAQTTLPCEFTVSACTLTEGN